MNELIKEAISTDRKNGISKTVIPANYNQQPTGIIKSVNREIVCFKTEFEAGNIDHSVVRSFGEEWKKFHQFDDEEINRSGKIYFDIISEQMINKGTYGADIGCGSGRWTKYVLDRIGFMEAIDPSDAIFAADKLLENKTNVRLTKASTDNIPFADETFDFAMSLGVLHHIPNTEKAMMDCVKKVKIGGYFYTYLYYNLDNRSAAYKALLWFATLLRRFVSALPMRLKKFVCDLIAIFIYMPIILIGRLLYKIGLKKLSDKWPLRGYRHESFFVIRNDALDRFGTSLEQRFSRQQITDMMTNCGLSEIVIADKLPFWRAVGKRIK